MNAFGVAHNSIRNGDGGTELGWMQLAKSHSVAL